MPDYPLSDWSGGITDNYLDSRPNQHKEMYNVVLSRQGKPVKRFGCEVVSTSLSDSNPISNIKVFDKQNVNGTLKDISVLSYVDKVRVNLAASSIKGPSPASNEMFKSNYINQSSQTCFTKWRDHIIGTLSTFSSDKNLPFKIYNITSGTPIAVRTGLPKMNGPDFYDSTVSTAETVPIVPEIDNRNRFIPFYGSGSPAIPIDEWSSLTTYSSSNQVVSIVDRNSRQTSMWRVINTVGNLNKYPPDSPTFWTQEYTDIVTFYYHYARKYISDGVEYLDYGPINFWSIYVPSNWGSSPDQAFTPTGGWAANLKIKAFWSGISTQSPPGSGGGDSELISANGRLLPYSDMYSFVYRTRVNETNGLFDVSVASTSAYTTEYKNKVDTALGQPFKYQGGGEPLATVEIYTNGGRVSNDAPPECRFLTMANDSVWYGGIRGFPNRIMQSVQGDPDSVPGDFYLDLDDAVSALGTIDIFPIVFAKRKVWRIEGQRDSLGRGITKAREISRTVGCVGQNSVVSVENKRLYFAGVDGFYVTDGYSVTKLSNHLNKTYKTLNVEAIENVNVGQGVFYQRGELIHGSFDSYTGRVVWRARQDTIRTNTDRIFVHDPYFGINNQEGTFTIWDGGPDNAYSSQYDSGFRARSIAFLSDGTMYRGDANGVLFLHQDGVYYDRYPTIAGNPKRPIFMRLTSHSTSFGGVKFKKWVTGFVATFRRITNNLSITPVSINDDQTENEKYMNEIRIRGVASSGKTHQAKKRFPSNGLRALYKAIGFENRPTIIRRSDDYEKALVSNASNTATVTLGGNAWPENVYEGRIYFSFDNYTNGYRITSPSNPASYPTLTITVSDPGNTLQDGTWGWYIKGVPKDEAFHLEGCIMDYEEISDAISDQTNAGANA